MIMEFTRRKMRLVAQEGVSDLPAEKKAERSQRLIRRPSL